MKKPLDPWEGKTQEEKDELIEDFRELDITPAEERAMILAAIKTIVPPVMLILAILYIISFILF